MVTTESLALISQGPLGKGISFYFRSTSSDEKGGTINTGNGNDTITGIGNSTGIDLSGSRGIPNGFSIDTGNGNDIITGTGIDFGITIASQGSIDTGNGDDLITGNGTVGIGISFSSYLNTGDGNSPRLLSSPITENLSLELQLLGAAEILISAIYL